ncbi:iron transporter [Pusillimonas sp. CC-YST705]|uniref:Iron transporter n=1 Tax=Mesopusillimonas faecipullorum TaxID=2755040 RepID=A0ABS8CBK4_9BURK|nr:iron transporter [Mesopusillimonas faecipullorum]MCB5363411.1 iron transporter [Mesopusillimonas faecipullorum]
MEMLKRGSWWSAGRRDVAVRTVLAIFAGYALSALSAACLSLYLPLARAEAVMVATMLAFLIYAILVIWAYSTARVGRMAGIWVATAAVLSAALMWGGRA